MITKVNIEWRNSNRLDFKLFHVRHFQRLHSFLRFGNLVFYNKFLTVICIITISDLVKEIFQTEFEFERTMPS